MLHSDRHFVVVPVESAEKLTTILTEQTWCLCNGFELCGHWFLNDSTHEDGASEYAVVKKDDASGPAVQVESITASWCSYDDLLEYIRRIIARQYDDEFSTPLSPCIETPTEHGRCPHCA